jgi:hypothetical protein
MTDENKKEKKEDEGVVLTAAEAKQIRGMLKDLAAIKEENEALRAEVDAVKTAQAEGKEEIIAPEIAPKGLVNFPHLPENDTKVVIGWTKRNVFTERNAANSLLIEEWIELVIAGEEKPKKVLYVDFMKFPRKRYAVKEKRILGAKIIKNGLIPKARFDDKEGTFVETGESVEDQVIIPRAEYVVDINGTDYTVEDRFVNI